MLPISKHFQLEQLAHGVYAAIVPDIIANIGANANAGIVDLGDATLVFDAFLTPAAAADLCAAAEQVTGRPPDYVINSHYHYDHVRGNQAFPAGAAVISTTKTRELIATKGAEHIRQDSLVTESDVHQLEERIRTSQDPLQREYWCIEAAEAQVIQASLPLLRLRLPDMTFDSRMTLHRSERTAHLITLGGGHTESDAFVVLPRDRIAFLGDLLFVGHHPFLGHGDPDALNRILAAVEQMGVEIVVPGHGPVGTTADLRRMRHYLAALKELTQAVIDAGGSAADAANQAVPEAFVEWRFAFFFAMNLSFLYQRLSSQNLT